MTVEVRLDDLPGVRGHVRRVGADLVAGRSCLWLLPKWVTAEAHLKVLLNRLRDDVELLRVEHVAAEEPGTAPAQPPAPDPLPVHGMRDRLDQLLALPESKRPPPTAAPTGILLVDRAYKAITDFGYAPPSPGADPLAALARWRSPRHLVLAIRADREADERGLRELIERYPALVRARGSDRAEMATLLVIGSPYAITGVEDVDQLTTASHWWWGVVRRLDLLVLVRDLPLPRRLPPRRVLLDELCDDLVPEIVSELAGPDLNFAAVLVREWDGTRPHLHELAGKLAAGNAHQALCPQPSLARPTEAQWTAWVNGDVAAWDGTVRSLTRALPANQVDADIEKRLWIAHARALNSVLDEIRGDIIRYIRENSTVRAADGLAAVLGEGKDIENIELGPLARAARQGQTHLEKPWLALLDTAAAVRNQLAHREPVRDDLLAKLHQYRTRTAQNLFEKGRRFGPTSTPL